MAIDSTQDLVNVLSQLQHPTSEVDQSLLKYVIYARKSTESEERQVRSLGDQINECNKLASLKGLKVINPPIVESESAKEPDIRPKFREMIEDLKKGKYDSILAWHPDRLARNMKDAGELIDLIDKRIIKDLQFCSFTFENNTMGKMLLGIAFVLSKQYSDQLSDNVKRGIRGRIEKGEYLSQAKHGYYKDKNKFLRPDGNNFILIKQAWKMRLANRTLSEIADFLNRSGYSKPIDETGEKHETCHITLKRLSELFVDPFYCGVLLYSESQKMVVDLTTIYDFVPMLSPPEFLSINKIKDISKAFKLKYRGSSDPKIKADFLRGLIYCYFCNFPMVAGITSKKSKSSMKYYFYFRCDTPSCKFENKSVRGKIIVDFVIKFLNEHKFTSPDVYEHYINELRRIKKINEKDLNSQKMSLLNLLKQTEFKIEKTKDLLLIEKDEYIKSIFKKDLKQLETNITNLKSKIEKISLEKRSSETVELTYAKFIELFNSLPDKISQTKSIKEKGFLISKIFLNFTIKDGKVLSYQLNKPFDGFIKEGKFLSSRGGGN